MGKNKGTISIIILASLVVVIVGIILVYKNQITNQPQIVNKSPSSGSQELKTFQSESMDLLIKIPNDFQVEEKFTTIDLINSEGKILISKNSTNLDNLDDYLSDLKEKNKFELEDKRSLNIDDKPTLEGKIDSKKIYLIYVPNRVYSISTEVESLYDDLDQIAQSFRYVP